MTADENLAGTGALCMFSCLQTHFPQDTPALRFHTKVQLGGGERWSGILPVFAPALGPQFPHCGAA